MTTTKPRLALTATALAVLVLTNQAQAQQAEDNMTRVEVTGSSIKRIATENALPLTTYKAEELETQGLTTMSEVATSLVTGATNEPVGGGGGGTMINMRGLNTNRTRWSCSTAAACPTRRSAPARSTSTSCR